MRCAFVVPYATELEFVDLARLAEARGWDAILTWEAVWGKDAWATLAAAAVGTDRIRLGTMLTPIGRHRPWDVAGRIATVDRLSNGRVTVAVGLGAPNANWLAFEPDEGRAVRVARTDEALAIYAGLMGGQPFEYTGRYYSARATDELVPPPPVQRPHPPVWVVGALVPGTERQRSLERAARWQGIVPAVVGAAEGSSGLDLDSLVEIVARVKAMRTSAGLPWAGYDVVIEGDSWGGFGQVHGSWQPWHEAGATWWVESWWDLPDGPDGTQELYRRVEAGPPAAG